jgi:hypothetical protein
MCVCVANKRRRGQDGGVQEGAVRADVSFKHLKMMLVRSKKGHCPRDDSGGATVTNIESILLLRYVKGYSQSKL